MSDLEMNCHWWSNELLIDWLIDSIHSFFCHWLNDGLLFTVPSCPLLCYIYWHLCYLVNIELTCSTPPPLIHSTWLCWVITMNTHIRMYMIKDESLFLNNKLESVHISSNFHFWKKYVYMEYISAAMLIYTSNCRFYFKQ